MRPSEVGVQVGHRAPAQDVLASGDRGGRWRRLEGIGGEEFANSRVCLVAVDEITEGGLGHGGRVVPPVHPGGDAVGEHEELDRVAWLAAVERQAVTL